MKDKIQKEFQIALENEGKAATTITSYTGDVNCFIEWLETKDVDFQGQLQRLYITQYKEYLMKESYAIDTINKKVNSLSSFNQYLIEKDYTKDLVVFSNKDKIKIASGSRAKVDIFIKEELETILFHLEDKDKVSFRNKLIVHILLYTGVRVSELIGIRRTSDIDFLTSHLKVVGKGGKYREIPLKPELLALIKEYIETERKDSRFSDSEYLLVSQRSPKLDRDTINKVLNKIADDIKANTGKEIRIYPHKWRHQFCSMLIDKGVDITTVSELAGHSSVDLTMSIYVQISQENKMEAVNLL